MSNAITQAKETIAQPRTSPTAQNVVDLLRDLVRAYTKHHQHLKIMGGAMPGSIALSIQGHEDDQGKLVGTQGANIWALTKVFEAIGKRLRKPILLTLLPPHVGQRGVPDSFQRDPQFKHGPTTLLLRRTLAMVFTCPFGLSHVMVGDALHYEIKPDDSEALVFGADLRRAVHSIFHAIGKSRGCMVYVAVNAGEEPAAPAQVIEPTKPVPLTAPRLSRDAPVDRIDAEARERGFA